MPDSPVLVWFRQDLRLADNPALLKAAGSGRPVICLYVLDDETPGHWKAGGASRWWLHHSLKALRQGLEKKGGTLILRRGRAVPEILRLVRETEAAAVYWNRCYEPFALKCERELATALGKEGVSTQGFNASLLYEPGSVCTRSGDPYKVFSAFWRTARELQEPEGAESAPPRIRVPSSLPESSRLEDWKLLPDKPDWAGGLRQSWTPGEVGARRRLEHFLGEQADGYAANRDRPDLDGTSRLSPHLHYGEISPRTVWQAAGRPESTESVRKFLSELGWREFSSHLLYHFPDLPETCLSAKYQAFPWQPDKALFRAWSRGETGYPLVDAGMRQLWQTGWMHNRVRMNAGSLLVKHLLQPWLDGAEWFWDTLVDADLASNTVNWQWVAGCGADAAPYFRVFNPVLQGERFDPDGNYVRRYVPELAHMPPSHIHKPWEAPQSVLDKAGVRLGKDYPRPVIGHREGRRRALTAFNDIKDTPG